MGCCGTSGVTGFTIVRARRRTLYTGSHSRLVDESEVQRHRVFGAKYVRDDLDGLKEVILYEQRVREHEDGLR
jgi:hypothetical protein